jgi:hypothetical protein
MLSLFFTLYTEVKAVIRHAPGNTSAEDISVALQEIGYDDISVQQTMAKHPAPGGVAHTSLPLPSYSSKE